MRFTRLGDDNFGGEGTGHFTSLTTLLAQCQNSPPIPDFYRDQDTFDLQNIPPPGAELPTHPLVHAARKDGSSHQDRLAGYWSGADRTRGLCNLQDPHGNPRPTPMQRQARVLQGLYYDMVGATRHHNLSDVSASPVLHYCGRQSRT
jgi:hypothetical protein